MLEQCGIYSTVMYCDDEVKFIIYVAATTIEEAQKLFEEDYHLNEIKKNFKETCAYSLTELCNNFSDLDNSEQNKFFFNDNSFVLIFGECNI